MVGKINPLRAFAHYPFPYGCQNGDWVDGVVVDCSSLLAHGRFGCGIRDAA